MTKEILIFCYLTTIFLLALSSPIEDVKNVVEDIKAVDEHKETDVENRVHDNPNPVPEAQDRIDEDIPAVLDDNVPVKAEKEDLETANTFWGGYYRSPSWGWRRGWGGYGGSSWGYPYYRSYGWGGRGYNGWGGWGGYNRGWGGYYWR